MAIVNCIGCFLLSLFVVFDSSDAKVFVSKPTTAQLLTREPQSLFSKKLSTTRTIQDPLLLRGGGSLLPIEPTAKIATLLAGISNIHLVFFPEENGRFFKLPTSPYLDVKRRYIAYSGLAHALAAGLLLFTPENSVSTPTAAMAGFSIFAAPYLVSTKFHRLVGHILGLFVFFRLANEQQRLVIRGIALTGFVGSFLLAFFPPMEELFSSSSRKQQIQGKEVDDDMVVAFFNRFLGASNMGFFLFVVLLSEGMNTCRAIGYSLIPTLVNLLIQNFVTNDVKSLGVGMVGQLLALAFTSATVITLT